MEACLSIAVVFFALSLLHWLDGRRRNQKVPGTVPAQTMGQRKFLWIAAAVMLGIVLPVWAVVYLLPALALIGYLSGW